jgi:hypothetical protein
MGKVGRTPLRHAVVELGENAVHRFAGVHPLIARCRPGAPVRGVIAQATTKRGAKTIAEILPTVTRISSLAIMIDVRGLRDRRGRKTIRPESFVGIFTFAQPFLHAACLCDRDGASVRVRPPWCPPG